MTTTKLAESVMDSLQDSRQSLSDFLAALTTEANYQADRAAKEAADYTTEELEYWAQVKDEAQPRYEVDPKARRTHNAAVNLLWAIDKGYYLTNAEEVASSAFVAALRAEVTK